MSMPSLRVVSAADVAKVMEKASPDELADLMGLVFSRLSSSGSSDAVAPARSSINTLKHTVLFMPTRMKQFGTAIKVVSVPSSADDKRGLPASTMVLDEDTGAVRALINASSLTAFRTAAGSLLSTRLLLGAGAQPNSILAFGAGKQIEAHVDLHLRAYPSIVRVAVVNRTVHPRGTDLIRALLPHHPDVDFTVSALEGNDLRTLLSSAAIIIAATSSTEPLFGAYEKFVRPGAHVILVGSYKPNMQEVSSELLYRTGSRLGRENAAQVVVDSREACSTEAGELMKAKIDREDMIEIGELVTINDDGTLSPNERKCAQARSAGDLTVFKSVGVGVQDVAIADFILRQVEGEGGGVIIDDYHN